MMIVFNLISQRSKRQRGKEKKRAMNSIYIVKTGLNIYTYKNDDLK